MYVGLQRDTRTLLSLDLHMLSRKNEYGNELRSCGLLQRHVRISEYIWAFVPVQVHKTKAFAHPVTIRMEASGSKRHKNLSHWLSKTSSQILFSFCEDVL